MRKLIVIMLLSVSVSAFAQGSISWEAGMNVSNNSFSNMHPRVSIDGSGNPMVIWGRMSDQSVFFSKWNGTSFTVPVKLNPPSLTIATASWMGPDIASKGDTVYVVVKQTPEASDTCHIYLLRSFNGGNTFSKPVRVDFIADSISRFPTVTVDESGNPIVAFMKFNSSFLQSRWVIAKSTDYGSTFSVDVKASGYSGAKAEVCDCCPGAIVSAGSTSTMLYRDNLSNIRDIWIGVSNDNSNSFKYGFAVDNNKWLINSCPASGPDGVIVGDTLYSVFMSSGSGNYRTYLSKFSISSAMLNKVSNLTGAIAGLSQQNYPRIASEGKAMAIVWKQNVNGVSQLPILFTNNIADGFPTTYDMVDLNDITNADVAISKGKVFVVWEDDNSGTIKFRSGTFSTASNSVNEIEQKSFSIYPSPTSDFLTIQIDESVMANSKLKITNELGETILTSNISKGIPLKLNVASFDKGVYFIQILSNNKNYSHKFIKQ